MSRAGAAIDALYEAGCDDALIGRTDGIQYIEFDREAAGVVEAVLSAVADIERVDGVKVTRIADAGLVSMADIAVRTGRTREGVRLLVTGARGPGGFPPPVTDPRSRYRLWRWSDVERWLTVSLGETRWPQWRTTRWPPSTQAWSSVIMGTGSTLVARPVYGRWPACSPGVSRY